MSWFSVANDFIDGNRALVVAMGVPILTAVVAAIVTLVTTRMNLKAQKMDRDLQQKLWILNAKKENFERLKAELVAFCAITFEMKMILSSPDLHGNVGEIRKDYTEKAHRRIIEFISSTNLITGLDCEEIEKLSPAMWHELRISSGDKTVTKLPPDERLAAVSKRVIDRLQRQLFSEAITCTD